MTLVSSKYKHISDNHVIYIIPVHVLLCMYLVQVCINWCEICTMYSYELYFCIQNHTCTYSSTFLSFFQYKNCGITI